jgi:ABC-type branched-subunit amino acid transport system substrate-binding protein
MPLTKRAPPYARRRSIAERATVAALIACGAIAFAVPAQSGIRTELRIGLVTPAASREPFVASANRGTRLGAAEAKKTAALFGDDVQLFEMAGQGASAIDAAQKLLSGRHVQVLIGSSPADADALSRFAESHRMIFLNVASRSTALRAACRRYTFHVEGSDAMYANAESMYANDASAGARNGRLPRAIPSARVGGARRDSALLWGSTLERFGASQINDRYRSMFHSAMDGPAWAGWAAVKIVSEAALRAHTAAPAMLVAYLEAPSSEFDGHKGWPLSFRRSDHQLRQPLYIVAAQGVAARQEILRDVPELRATNGASSLADQNAGDSDRILDALVDSPDARKCPWSER